MIGPLFKRPPHITDTFHPGRVPGDGELVESLIGAGTRGFRVTVGGLDRRQVAEHDGALLSGLVGQALQDLEERLPSLGKVSRLELSVALERGQPGW